MSDIDDIWDDEDYDRYEWGSLTIEQKIFRIRMELASQAAKEQHCNDDAS